MKVTLSAALLALSLVSQCRGKQLKSLLVSDDDILTPERLISAPRPNVAKANPAGDAAIFGARTYSFERDDFDNALFYLNLSNLTESGDERTIISRNASDAFWLSDTHIGFVRTSDNRLIVHHVAGRSVTEKSSDPTEGSSFPAPIDTVRVTRHNGRVTLVFSAQVYGDGDLCKVKEHDESSAVAEWKRVKVFDDVMIRHWDTWLYPGKRSQLFAVDLQRTGSNTDDVWSFKGDIRNLLNGTSLESPVPPFGDEGDYDVNGTHIVFTARDPGVSAAWHTRQNVFLAPLDGSSRPIELTSGKHGATSSPRFSHDGQRVVWLQMEIDGFESDRRRIYIYENDRSQQLHAEQNAFWDLSPTTVSFAPDGRSLLGIVERKEHEAIFRISLEQQNIVPEFITREGGVSAFETLSDGSLLVTASSLKGPSEAWLFPSTRKDDMGSDWGEAIKLTDFSRDGSLSDLDLGPDPEQFSYPGSRGREAYGWIIKPPGYDEAKTYPLAVLIHGGPEGSWSNSWSTRWNPLVFAAQGFIVITLDPAGSTGFGQGYQEEILHHWGSTPFDDIRLGTKHILRKFHGIIDAERVVAAGASYGGYMINWINGHNEDRLFKGLVCHDGVFSTLSTWYATDELYFPEHEFGGVPWNDRRSYEKYSPEQYVQHWNTPQLIVAGGQDFRLPETEGISAFNALKRKGIDARLVYFPDENHWVREPKNSLKWHQEVLSWLLAYSSVSSSKTATLTATDPVLFVNQARFS